MSTEILSQRRGTLIARAPLAGAVLAVAEFRCLRVAQRAQGAGGRGDQGRVLPGVLDR